MDTGRDLGQVELWQASLERSRARRNQPATRRRRTPAMAPVAGLGGISAIALLGVSVFGNEPLRPATRVAFALKPSALPTLQPRPSTHLHAASSRAAPATVTHTVPATVTHKASVTTPALKPPRSTPRSTVVRHAAPVHHTVTAIAPEHTQRPVHTATVTVPQSYVNPLAHASVTAERIDQGVDYAGSGTLGALGAASITYVGTANTGWPGAFIEFRLLNGPDKGRYVYYAESIVPAVGLHVGQTVRAGQAIATITSGIEIGWGANIGTETYAASVGQWSAAQAAGGVATASGRAFSALVASLGGPAGVLGG